MHDWMRAVRTPTSYRVGNTRFNLKPQFQYMILILCAFFILVYIMLVISDSSPHYKKTSSSASASDNSLMEFKSSYLNDDLFMFNQNNAEPYNTTYPLSRILQYPSYNEYKIALIADMDTDSKNGHSSYISYLLKGTLIVYNDLKKASVSFDDPIELNSQYAYGDRGMELSELIVFNGKLYSCDDRTGIVYEIVEDHKKPVAHPWVILTDGDGKTTNKGFKCEWMTVKNNLLYVGSLGKEWTTTKGELVNHNPQWIKVITHTGHVKHVDWVSNYNKMREASGYSYPGYMIFESGAWHKNTKRWYFLPRRASKDSYDEKLDEQRATNILIETNEAFDDIKTSKIGHVNPIRGYSSFKFIPNIDDSDRLIVATKSEEDSGKISTYITVFNTDGYILLKDTLVSDRLKYEGVEFI